MRRILQILLLFFALVTAVIFLGAVVQGEMLAALIAGLMAIALVWTGLRVPYMGDQTSLESKPTPVTKGNFTIRDMGWLTLLCAVCCSWWVDHAAHRLQRSMAIWPDYVREWVLHRDKDREVCVTEHRQHGMIQTPIWQVWQRTKSIDSWEPLFTVEGVWDSNEPGVPTIRQDEDHLVVTDPAGSYEYDLEKGRFRGVNVLVYPGAYRSTLPPNP